MAIDDLEKKEHKIERIQRQTNKSHRETATRAAAASVAQQQQQFSWEEVSKHSTGDDLYIAIRGKVYDLTSFQSRHPGGKDVLMLAAGRDATQVFETYHPFLLNVDSSSTTTTTTTSKEGISPSGVLAKFCVGELVGENELPTFPKSGKFYIEVRKRVYQYFADTKQDYKNNFEMWFRYLSIYLTIIICWSVLFYTGMSGFFTPLFLSVLMGIACALVGLVPLHDSSHFAITHKPWVWRALGASHDFLNGASYYVWLHQHTLGHHPYTNIDGADPDVETSEHDFRRIKESQRWVWQYVYQHIYVPILYCFLGIKTRIQDCTMLFLLKKNGAIRVNNPTTDHLLIFITGKIFFVIYRFVIPMAFITWWKVAVFFLISDAVTSYWLALSFQANHIVHDAEWPEVPTTPLKNMKNDWAEMQLTTTQDYAHHSWWITFLTGSLNFQATHHLFPNILQIYYPQIAPIINATAIEFGIAPVYKETFLEALGSHLGYLRVMGQKKKNI